MRHWFVIAGCFFCFSTGVFGQALRIATIELAPAGYIENGKVTGIYYDIANEIAERANLDYVNALKPYVRTVHELKSGKTDVSIVLYNPVLLGKATPLAPVFKIETLAIGRKGVNIKSLNELKGKKVGVIRGSNFVKPELMQGIEIFSVKDNQQAMRMLHAGRLDAFIGVNIGVYYSMNKFGYARSEFGIPYVANSQSTFLYVSDKFTDKQSLKALKAAVEQMSQDGTIQKITEKYIGQ
ncbi:transporter substrate-binding domain-containing protein [Vibrio profundum]|uniref:substrate-binding periplasmic protein n=1 Tax=Vibrio profundum TaxID=2910247 RepID=UPI003D11D2B5